VKLYKRNRTSSARGITPFLTGRVTWKGKKELRKRKKMGGNQNKNSKRKKPADLRRSCRPRGSILCTRNDQKREVRTGEGEKGKRKKTETTGWDALRSKINVRQPPRFENIETGQKKREKGGEKDRKKAATLCTENRGKKEKADIQSRKKGPPVTSTWPNRPSRRIASRVSSKGNRGKGEAKKRPGRSSACGVGISVEMKKVPTDGLFWIETELQRRGRVRK